MGERKEARILVPSEIKEILSGLGIAWDRRHGQHFLTDGRVLDRQVAYAKLSRRDTVLEIGPGLGALTGRLLGEAGKVVAIEKDTKLTEYLETRFSAERKSGKLQIIAGDALRTGLPEFDKVVSNLPYEISSEITFRLLENTRLCPFKLGILMYQKEFAERMAARCGSDEYSRLSVNVYYRAECEVLENVPGSAFFPRPEVDSAMVRLVPRTSPPFRLADEGLFFEIVEALFSHRRKKIGNGIELWLRGKGMKKCGWAKELPFAGRRVETLEPREIGELCDEIASRMTMK